MHLFRHVAALIVTAALSLGVLGGVAAEETRVAELTISNPWTRATAPGMPAAAGFFTVTNSGGETDRLVRASTPAAAMVEIHRSLMVDGVMRMEPVAGGVEIPAGATVEFAPGGLHLMLMHPKEPFALGSTVPMTLEFEQAGSVDGARP